MAIKRQTFNNGAQGDVITAANSADSGDAITTVINVNGRGVYEVGAALRGAKGAHVTGTVNDTFQITMSNTSDTSATAQVYFRMVSYPTVSGAIFRLRSSTGNIALFHVNTSGVLSIQNSVGTGLKNFMSNTALALNTTYRINLRATPNASTSSGFIGGELYSDDDTLLDSYSSNSVNAGTTLDVQTAAAGKLAAPSDGFNMYFDELAFDTGTTSQINPVSPIFKQNTAEGGTDGTTVTTGNSGGASGDAFSTVSVGTGTITYTNTLAHTGAYSINISPGSGTASSFQYNFNVNLNIQRMSVRAYVYLTAFPSTGTQWLTIGNTGNAAVIAIGSNGRPFVQDGTGTNNTSLTAISLNTWLRLELTAVVGDTTSTGTIVANIYNGDDITNPVYSYSSTARNTTTAPLTYALIGKATNSGSWATMYIDDFTVTDAPLPIPINTAIAPWVFA